jgi:hypothetical protein
MKYALTTGRLILTLAFILAAVAAEVNDIIGNFDPRIFSPSFSPGTCTFWR